MAGAESTSLSTRSGKLAAISIAITAPVWWLTTEARSTPSASRRVTARPQDRGGREGYRAVPIERDEPVYHERWEGTVIAGILATIMAGLYSVDQFRAGIDNLEPLSYISIGYYRRRLHTLEVNCVSAGVFSPEELETRIAELAAGAPMPVRDDPRLAQALKELIEQGASNARPVPREPRFAVGERVRGRCFP